MLPPNRAALICRSGFGESVMPPPEGNGKEISQVRFVTATGMLTAHGYSPFASAQAAASPWCFGPRPSACSWADWNF